MNEINLIDNLNQRNKDLEKKLAVYEAHKGLDILRDAILGENIKLEKKLTEANAALDNLNEINETELRLRQKYEKKLALAVEALKEINEQGYSAKYSWAIAGNALAKLSEQY